MFILLFFPALILVLNDIRRFVRETWSGEKIEPEHVEIAWLNAQRKFDESIYHEEEKEVKSNGHEPNN